jgi:hypothetical protein
MFMLMPIRLLVLMFMLMFYTNVSACANVFAHCCLKANIYAYAYADVFVEFLYAYAYACAYAYD